MKKLLALIVFSVLLLASVGAQNAFAGLMPPLMPPPGVLSLSIIDFSMNENGGVATGTVCTTSSNDSTVNLSSSDTSEATVPASVFISVFSLQCVQFSITAVDDTILDGTQTVTITASAIGQSSVSDTIDVRDNEILAVGGEMFPVDTTALLLAASYSTASWMIPLMIAAVGFGIIITHQKSKLKHNSCPSCKLETEDFFELGDKVVSKCDNPKCRVNLFFIRRYRNSFK